MMYSMNIMNMMFSMNFIINKHPLSMGLILILQTILSCLTVNFYISSAWFSYIMFLIMIGGMLVLFIYMTSLASNEMFSISINKIYMYIIMMIITSTIIILMINMINLIFNQNEMMMMNNSYMKNMALINSIIKLYNYPTMNLTIFLMNYLLLTLIVTMKITKNFSSTLRQMTYV